MSNHRLQRCPRAMTSKTSAWLHACPGPSNHRFDAVLVALLELIKGRMAS